MWVQIDRTKKKKKKVNSKDAIINFFVFVIVYVVLLLTRRIGFEKNKTYLSPKSWAEAALFSIFVTLIFFIFSRLENRKNKEVICLSCETIKHIDNEVKCKCGGIYVSTDDVELIEDDKSHKNIR